MENKNEFTTNGVDNKALAAGIKTGSVVCPQAPMAMNGKHAYGTEGRCIYCGEQEPKSELTLTLNEIPGNEKVKTEHGPKCPGSPPLTGTDITGIMGAFEAYARILAIQARIEGMKVRNVLSGISGFSPQYGQYDFDCMADELKVQAAYLQSKQINR